MCGTSVHGRKVLFAGIVTGFFMIAMCRSAYAHMDMKDMTTKRTAIGFQEKLGSSVPLDLTFKDENGKDVTGDQKDIDRLTKTVGFGCVKTGDDYEHPVGLIILSHDGKIIRYVYGITFLPFQVKMALIEASQGRIGPTVNRLLDV